MSLHLADWRTGAALLSRRLEGLISGGLHVPVLAAAAAVEMLAAVSFFTKLLYNLLVWCALDSEKPKGARMSDSLAFLRHTMRFCGTEHTLTQTLVHCRPRLGGTEWQNCAIGGGGGALAKHECYIVVCSLRAKCDFCAVKLRYFSPPSQRRTFAAECTLTHSQCNFSMLKSGATAALERRIAYG